MHPHLEDIIGPVDWPHAPPHRLDAAGTYMITAGTLHKQRFFNNRAKLRALHPSLLSITREYEWQLQAWAVFSNHYHFIAKSPQQGDSAHSLGRLISKLHTTSAIALNRTDATPGRQIWHNYWDTRLTFHTSWLARLRYVKYNAVHHGLVRRAADYPWCSQAWFERTASASFVESVRRFETGRVRVVDDFECRPR